MKFKSLGRIILLVSVITIIIHLSKGGTVLNQEEQKLQPKSTSENYQVLSALVVEWSRHSLSLKGCIR